MTTARLSVVLFAVTWTAVTIISSYYTFFSQNVVTSGLIKPVSMQLAMPNNDNGLEPRTLPMSGYIIADAYGDQLSGAVRAYYQLAEIASHWNLRIVEPHIDSGKWSALKGLPRNRHTYLRYEDLYNTSEVYKELDRCLGLVGQKLVVTLEELLVKAPMRQFVALVFPTKRSEIQVSGNKPSVYNCSGEHILSTLEDKLNSYLQEDSEIKRKVIARHREQYKFKGVHAICVSSLHFSLRDVQTELLAVAKEYSQSSDGELPELMVVIPEWRLISPHSSAVYYFHDPDFTWRQSTNCDSFTIPHGEMVIRAADAFSQSLNVLHPILCIHMRIEGLALAEPKHKGFWRGCVQRLEPTIQTIKSKHNLTTRNIIAIHDMGKYGSGTAGSNSLSHLIKRDVLGILDRLGIAVIEYEPLDFNQPANTGFVSLVEKEFLSRADYLLTLGVGSYQRSLIFQYLKAHSESHFYSIGFKELA